MTETELHDAIVRHALALQRLSASDESEAVKILRQLEAELKALLGQSTLTELGKRDINAIIAQAEKAIAGHYGTVAGVVDVEGVMAMVAENTAKAMQAITAGQAAYVTAETLASLAQAVLIDGAPTAAWWAKQSADTAFKFAGAVRQGVVNGETNERIVARIAGKDGFMEISRRNARSLVHSSIMTAANKARMETFRKNGKYCEGIRWLATLDSHTCKTCMALDGATWDFDGKPNLKSKVKFQGLPPRHWSCRCVVSLIPSLSSIRELDPIMADEIEAGRMRASKDGPVPVAGGFDAFLKRQSPAFIADMLGKRRAELYGAGKLTLQDLVSGTGRPLTLDELASRN
jgi:SPP1 gp7 family putative phage head morphogenesis protein